MDLWRTGRAAGNRVAGVLDDRGNLGRRSCKDRGEGSHEVRHGRDRRNGRGSSRQSAVHDAEANDSLPSCHHNSPDEGEGFAHGMLAHDSHPYAGYSHAAARGGRSHPSGEAADNGAESATDLDLPESSRAESVLGLADREGTRGK